MLQCFFLKKIQAGGVGDIINIKQKSPFLFVARKKKKIRSTCYTKKCAHTWIIQSHRTRSSKHFFEYTNYNHTILYTTRKFFFSRKSKSQKILDIWLDKKKKELDQLDQFFMLILVKQWTNWKSKKKKMVLILFLVFFFLVALKK